MGFRPRRALPARQHRRRDVRNRRGSRRGPRAYARELVGPVKDPTHDRRGQPADAGLRRSRCRSQAEGLRQGRRPRARGVRRLAVPAPRRRHVRAQPADGGAARGRAAALRGLRRQRVTSSGGRLERGANRRRTGSGRRIAARGRCAGSRAATGGGAPMTAVAKPTRVEISPLSVVAPDVELGDGSVARTVIGAQAVIRSHTVVYAGNVIGARFQTGHHVLLRESNTIGDSVSVGSLSVVEHHVTIGTGVRIHSQCFIPEYSVLEDGAWIGPRVTLTNAPFPRCPDVSKCLKGVHVGRDARVGANVTILPGVSIGERALIGAGAIVTKNVPAGAVVVGTPAQPVKSIEDLLCPVGLDHRPYPSSPNEPE